MYDRPDSIRRNRGFGKLLGSRTGPKWYLALMPLVALLFWMPTPVPAIMPLLFLLVALLTAAFVSRLNDIGWSRWHATWLTAWAVVVKLIMIAPTGPTLSPHAREQVFAVIGWPFIAVALLLAVPRGEKRENRFGPPPLGWREFRQARRANKAFLKVYKRSQPAINALMAQMRAAQEVNARLTKEYQDELNRFGIEGARKKKAELDAGHERFSAIAAQVNAAQAELKPTMDAARSGQQRISQVLAYRAR